MYFITICTQDRIHHFGNVVNEEMYLSDIGKLAQKFWAEIPEHFPFVILGEFIIMPDHMHGILIINKPIEKIDDEKSLPLPAQTLQCKVSGNGNDNSTGNKKQFMSDISPKPGSISTIIRSYKSAVTKHARKIDSNFGWQTRFHDHIIRDTRAFDRISNYIKNNPRQWGNKKKK